MKADTWIVHDTFAGELVGSTCLSLYDYRRAVFNLYRDRNEGLRAGLDPVRVWNSYGSARDELFLAHPQSALDEGQVGEFTGLRYFPYNPLAVIEASVVLEVDSEPLIVTTSHSETMPLIRVATLRFRIFQREAALTLFWIDVYGGGLFLPFHDATAPLESYGGGRYLFDTVKGSNFYDPRDEEDARRIHLDFNYAYNPSCAYSSRWSCPLAPPENRLPFAIRAGEMIYEGGAAEASAASR